MLSCVPSCCLDASPHTVHAELWQGRPDAVFMLPCTLCLGSAHSEGLRIDFGHTAMLPCRYEYFHLPRITEAQIKNSVELVLAASFSSSEGYSEWVAARPELLLIKVSLAGRGGSCLGEASACVCLLHIADQV